MNSILSNRIFKNIFSLSFGKLINQTIIFLSIAIAARKLGVEKFGLFASLLAISAILSRIVELGLSQIVFRETSKEKNNFKFINNALSLRLFSFVIILTLFNTFVFLTKVPRNEVLITNLLLFNILISSRLANFRDLLEIPFKVNLKMHYVMILNLLDACILLMLTINIPNQDSLFYFVVAYVISNLPGFAILLVLLYKIFGFKIKIYWGYSKVLLKQSLPLFGYLLLLVLFQQGDVTYLKMFDSKISAGLYSAAIRMTMPLSILPIAIIMSVFPRIVNNIGKNEIENVLIIKIIFKSLFLLSFFFALIMTFKASIILDLFFGKKYSSSSLTMIVLYWSYLFMYFNFFGLDLLVAYKKQNLNFVFALLLVLTLFLTAIILVPSQSFEGMAYSKLIASGLGFVFLVFVLIKVKIVFSFLSVRLCILIIIFSSLTFLLSFLTLLPFLILSSLFFIILILIIKVYSSEEVYPILKLFNKEKFAEYFK